jgi:hypothetical protein
MALRALALLAALIVAGPAPAQDSPPPATRTAKERLVDKASDEQRVDNCGVPPERRGDKPRPDACPHDRATTN